MDHDARLVTDGQVERQPSSQQYAAVVHAAGVGVSVERLRIEGAQRHGMRHALSAILAPARAAVLCGCTSLEEVAEWIGRADQAGLAWAGCRTGRTGDLVAPPMRPGRRLTHAPNQASRLRH